MRPGCKLNSATSNYLPYNLKARLDFVLAHAGEDERPFLRVRVFGVDMLGLLDSGASRTILGAPGLEILGTMKIKIQQARIKDCTVANGSSCEVIGSINIPFQIRDKVVLLDVLVIPSVTYSLILGADFWRRAGIVPDLRHGEWTFSDSPEIQLNTITSSNHLTAEQSLHLDQFINDAFRDFPEELGCTNLVKHSIKTSAEPIKQRHYPISPAVQKQVNIEVDKMLNDGIIEPSNSPWASPIVLVRKKDGSYRFCVDYRKVNKVTERDAYPLPLVTHTLDKLRDARYLSTLDIKSAYWQIEVDDASKPITAFVVPGRGLFQFKRLPFGLHNAPATWQRFIDRVLGVDLEPYVFVYLDDIIIVTQDFDQHLRVLKEVFRRLKDSGLTVSRDKCCFCRDELKYLGFVIDRKGLHVDPDKVQAILEIPTPRNVSEVRRILGMASWYRRFVPNFSTVVAPICRLLSKNVRFVWSDECEGAFRTIKEFLASAPVMSCPDFDRPFCIQTDASDYGLGAVLTQGYPDGDKVVAYISRSLTKNERKFSTVEKECLAVVWAIHKFRPYVEGAQFTVMTDHFSLQWLHNLKDPSGRLARWSVRLQQYDFNIVHRKGKDNVIPDALSRSVPSINALEVGPNIQDNWYAKMMVSIVQNPIQFPLWRKVGNVIYKRVRNPRPGLGDPMDEWVQIVPKELRQNVLRENHDSPTAGHAGIYKTYHRIASKYYWPKMKADITHYVRSCATCAQYKPERRRPPGQLCGRPDVKRPWQLVCADLVGPLPKSRHGNLYILTAQDYFTKFCIFSPLRTATSSNVAKLLENNVFLTFGAPETIVCDNGKAFVGREFKTLCASYNTSIAYTALYHPQANAVERVHQVMKTMLASYVQDNHRSWEDHLQKVACAIRTAKHEATGDTPYFANFGREMVLDGRDFKPKPEELRDDAAIKRSRAEGFESLFRDIRRRLDLAYRRAQRGYNLRHRDIRYAVGDRVWRKNVTRSDAAQYYTAKLAPKYLGPFFVHKRLSPWTYELRDSSQRAAGVWNAKDLKPFTEPDNPPAGE